MIALPYAEVIGDPVAHSKSPAIHKYWLKALGIEADYRKTHVKPEELAGYFFTRRSDPDWLGCNVTIPHKVAVMDHCADPGDVRTRIGAMNTVACETDGPLIGTNTDAGGFLQPLQAMRWSGGHAVMIGAGGAARAIGYALSVHGVTRLDIVARDRQKGMALLAHLGVAGDVLPFSAALPSADLLVNASPLGMTGQLPLDLDLAPLRDNAVVYDIVYAPLETTLLRRAAERRLTTVDGLAMLIGQAALAFEIFFDAVPPREDGDAALRDLLTAG